MKRFLSINEIKRLSPKQLIKYRKELKDYYPTVKSHVIDYVKAYSELEKIMVNRIEQIQDMCDELELDRLDSTEDDSNYFSVQ
jgi:hypothetical protein